VTGLDERGRCVVTELLPEQCACPGHRGGALPKELDPHGQGLASVRRDADDRTRVQWSSPLFLARFGGTCGWCERPFRAGDGVRYDTDDALVGPCCAETDMPQSAISPIDPGADRG
jgi:hypothetical protein